MAIVHFPNGQRAEIDNSETRTFILWEADGRWEVFWDAWYSKRQSNS